MVGHDTGFVDLNLTFQGHDGAAINNSLSKLLDQILSVTAMDVEFRDDLQRRQVQAHQFEADDPSSERLMTARKDGIGEVIEAFATAMTEVALAMRLCVGFAILDDRLG